MYITRLKHQVSQQELFVYKEELPHQWKKVQDSSLHLFELLAMSKSELDNASSDQNINEEEYSTALAFKPTAYRDFMLYEKHAIDAARGFVKKYIPHLLPIVTGYEKLFNKPFPKLKPSTRYFQFPIYYLGNHLNIVGDKTLISIPEYTRQLDYELEIAAFITKPLKNATPKQAKEAIGGFLILNDFSARDVQLDEIKTGFGPMKTKNFASSLSTLIVSKKKILTEIDKLIAKVYINDELIAEACTGGKLYSFEQAIAYASWEEQLHPGELFGSGTVPGCTGIENGRMLNKGDSIRLEVDLLGSLENSIKQ
ncbi:MAG: fumarylacetoacetate hydrolase family protein [Paraglaciecola sp.]|uniref:fumarylacetoacetate hydrolase family protein n=1 Tax=Paraglaciecola sp. TaxID=1920173 RepID=UPI00329A0B7B